MDLNTVHDVVAALVGTYAAGLECYTKWQRRKWQENHYRTATKGNLCRGNACALSTSLSVSGQRIREAFDGGADILGDGFIIGDETCRGTLQDNLECLQEHIYKLRKATRDGNGPLELYEVICISEAVRVSCLAALAKQYQRVAVGRLVPRDLPGSQQRSRLSVAISDENTVKAANDTIGDSHTTYHTANSHLQSEPPSPPPTPKVIPDDLQSTYTSISASRYGPRPKNSVFSVFCPEAMKYQVNPLKTMPKRKNCRCGYDWNGGHAEDKVAMMVKDGFHITPRFLGKSHCEGGFGCVLCTSSGKTEKYANAEDLKTHINATHTKWQMLHDRDLAGR
ncbi:hypothetical protein F4779DRAFT_556725 [Xylariaceae sp. FL0662B]|nr:hypothetical protein F4779DRAFT_556725 [Xylariaceae sp. FL0662B]